MSVLQLETLESLIAFNKDFAQKRFSSQDQFMPMVVGYTSDNSQRIIVAGIFNNNQEKEMFFKTASLVFCLYSIDKYVVMTEAYGLRYTEETKDEDPYEKYGSLAEHPNRMDLLSILAVNRHGAKMSSLEILPDRSLLETDLATYSTVSGRMTELLPPADMKKLSQAERDQRDLLQSLLSSMGSLRGSPITLEDL